MKHRHSVFNDLMIRTQLRKRNFIQQKKLIILFMINSLGCFNQNHKKLKNILGMAIAKCLGSSSNFSITNKHRMMGEHSR